MTDARVVTPDAAGRSRYLIAMGLALLAGVVWSFGAVAVQVSTALDPWRYLIWRSLGLIFMLEAWYWRRGGGLLLGRFVRHETGLAWLAAGCLALSALMVVQALMTTTVANTLFLISTAPLITLLLARLVLGEALSVLAIVAIGFGLAGVLVMTGGDFSGGSWFGNATAIGCALAFSAYSVCVRMAPDRNWLPTLSGYGLLVIAISLPVTLMAGKALLPDAGVIIPFLHGAAIMGTGMLLFNAAATRLPAVTLVILAQSETVLAPVWAALFLGERPPVATLVGGGLILLGLLVMATGVMRHKPMPPAALEGP